MLVIFINEEPKMKTRNHSSEVLGLKDGNPTIRETRKNNKFKCISVRHLFLLKGNPP